MGATSEYVLVTNTFICFIVLHLHLSTVYVELSKYDVELLRKGL